jgi:hypothetical protein
MKLMTTKIFSKIIEEKSIELDLELLDTITWYCEENGIEIESAAKMLTKNLKEKLYYDASKLRYVKKDPELPL